ncbi:NAD(P)H-dependent oxidoreductase [Pannonibacter carbonis]|uniref:NAD(P)H-dependent oxidoreductase n=1 Tax=Pannonibacter carbonis TaxID=2067569 RepID=UPI000D10E492|nr:NAD(P)H-dependent oxidoreductase [Pannonibacter carbonis]
MNKTLILLFHPDIRRSKANAALAAAAQPLADTEVVDVQARYPSGQIDMFTDGAVEAKMLLSASRIVLQFPIQWYSTPALLKAWQDAVLTRMYYVKASTEGARLAGTPLMIAATAGNVAEAYGSDGQNHYTIGEILTPLKAMAHRCGLPWHAPHILFAAGHLSDGALADAAAHYVTALKRFAAWAPAPVAVSPSILQNEGV